MNIRPKTVSFDFGKNFLDIKSKAQVTKAT